MQRTRLLDMHRILQALHNFDAQPCLDWIEKSLDAEKCSNETVISRLSTLQFDLHRLRYIQLLTTPQSSTAMNIDDDTNNNSDNNKMEESPSSSKSRKPKSVSQCSLALDYARKYFPKFPSRTQEIERLSGCLMYVGKLDQSPYADLLSISLWSQAQRNFVILALQKLQKPPINPLLSALLASTTAIGNVVKLHALLNKDAILPSSENMGIYSADLGCEHIFHTSFVCPVNKSLSDEMDENPAVLLKCGHVVSQDAIKKMSNNKNQRFKCPTCPREQTATETLTLHF